MGFPTDSRRTACENKGHTKVCVKEGHDRLACGRAARGGFALSMVYSYKLRLTSTTPPACRNSKHPASP